MSSWIATVVASAFADSQSQADDADVDNLGEQR